MTRRYPSAVLLLLLFWFPAFAVDSFLSDNIVTKGRVHTGASTRQGTWMPKYRTLSFFVSIWKSNGNFGNQPTGPIETTMCDYETVESVNEDLYNDLKVLVRTPFFRYFQVSNVCQY